jgi:hypothetical protein
MLSAFLFDYFVRKFAEEFENILYGLGARGAHCLPPIEHTWNFCDWQEFFD